MLRDRKWLILAVLAVVCLTAWTHALVSRPNELELTYLDVGEGLCGVMRTPSGKIVILDCGTSAWHNSDSIGEKLVVPYLRQIGADHIDLAVLSHPHSDHVSGYAGLVEAVPARVVLDIGARHGIPQYIRFLKAVKKCRAKYRLARRGQSIDLGDGVRIDVLNPDPAVHYPDLNENSMVLRVTFRKVAMLLCADAGAEAERHILDSGARVRSQVMQVGHHGSKTASTAEWLDAVRPSVAVISCGREYHHPSREVVAWLGTAGARVYRTDRNGAVSVITDGKVIRVRTFRSTR